MQVIRTLNCGVEDGALGRKPQGKDAPASQEGDKVLYEERLAAVLDAKKYRSFDGAVYDVVDADVDKFMPMVPGAPGWDGFTAATTSRGSGKQRSGASSVKKVHQTPRMSSRNLGGAVAMDSLTGSADEGLTDDMEDE